MVQACGQKGQTEQYLKICCQRKRENVYWVQFTRDKSLLVGQIKNT
jgi:hypothetical protein